MKCAKRSIITWKTCTSTPTKYSVAFRPLEVWPPEFALADTAGGSRRAHPHRVLPAERRSDAASPPEYERDLEEVIKDETSGDFTAALLAMLKANKDESDEVDLDRARRDAEVRTLRCTMRVNKLRRRLVCSSGCTPSIKIINYLRTL